jgi:hypothetical protein
VSEILSLSLKIESLSIIFSVLFGGGVDLAQSSNGRDGACRAPACGFETCWVEAEHMSRALPTIDNLADFPKDGPGRKRSTKRKGYALSRTELVVSSALASRQCQQRIGPTAA